MVHAVEHRDLDTPAVAERLGGIEPGESGPDDNHLHVSWHDGHLLSKRASLATISRLTDRADVVTG